MKIITSSWRSAPLSNPFGNVGRVIVPPEEEAAAAIDDGKAAQEAQQLASGKSATALAGEAAENEHKRDQRFKDHFELISLICLWLVAAGIFLAAAIWLLHMVAPPEPTCLRWLTDAQVQSLQNALTGIVLVGVLADHFKKRIG